MIDENLSVIFSLKPRTRNDLISEKSSISGCKYNVDSNIALSEILKSFVI